MKKEKQFKPVSLAPPLLVKSGLTASKIMSLKKPKVYPKVLIPPEEEKYIKSKKHDFL